MRCRAAPRTLGLGALGSFHPEEIGLDHDPAVGGDPVLEGHASLVEPDRAACGSTDELQRDDTAHGAELRLQLRLARRALEDRAEDPHERCRVVLERDLNRCNARHEHLRLQGLSVVTLTFLRAAVPAIAEGSTGWTCARYEDVEPVVEHNGTVPVWWLVKPREMFDITKGGHLELVNEFEVAGGGYVFPHEHPTHEFYYVTNGRGTMIIGDEEREIQQG